MAQVAAIPDWARPLRARIIQYGGVVVRNTKHEAERFRIADRFIGLPGRHAKRGTNWRTRRNTEAQVDGLLKELLAAGKIKRRGEVRKTKEQGLTLQELEGMGSQQAAGERIPEGTLGVDMAHGNGNGNPPKSQLEIATPPTVERKKRLFNHVPRPCRWCSQEPTYPAPMARHEKFAHPEEYKKAEEGKEPRRKVRAKPLPPNANPTTKLIAHLSDTLESFHKHQTDALTRLRDIVHQVLESSGRYSHLERENQMLRDQIRDQQTFIDNLGRTFETARRESTGVAARLYNTR